MITLADKDLVSVPAESDSLGPIAPANDDAKARQLTGGGSSIAGLPPRPGWHQRGSRELSLPPASSGEQRSACAALTRGCGGLLEACELVDGQLKLCGGDV